MSLSSNYVCEGQMSLFDLDIWCGKTSPEPSVQTKERISGQSLKKPQKLSVKMPLFLDLRGGAGHQAVALWETGGLLLGEYTMRSFGECSSVENVSLLSQILEDNPHPKYSLSPKACQGILRRAEKRGKKLPPLLRETLIRQATPLKLGGGVEVDSHGKKAGKGPLIQTELSGTLGVSQDQTLITKVVSVDEKMGQTYIGDNVGNTLGARDYKQPQAVVYGMSAYNSNAMKSSNPHSGIYEADTSRTLDLNGGTPACNQGGMAIVQTYQETTGALTPGAHPGSYNGQDAYNDMLVVGGGTEPITASKATFFLGAHSDGTAETLVATDYKDSQLVCYRLDRASFNQGQNAQYDFSIEEETAQTLVSRGPGGY